MWWCISLHSLFHLFQFHRNFAFTPHAGANVSHQIEILSWKTIYKGFNNKWQFFSHFKTTFDFNDTNRRYSMKWILHFQSKICIVQISCEHFFAQFSPSSRDIKQHQTLFRLMIINKFWLHINATLFLKNLILKVSFVHCFNYNFCIYYLFSFRSEGDHFYAQNTKWTGFSLKNVVRWTNRGWPCKFDSLIK